MIGVCTKCGQMSFTSEEDACDPNYLCIDCFRGEREGGRAGLGSAHPGTPVRKSGGKSESPAGATGEAGSDLHDRTK